MKKFVPLIIYAASLAGFLATPTIAQTPPFNAYSVSTLGGNCTQQGSVMVQTANGRSVCLGAGTAGQVLQSGGPGADVSWLTVSGAGTVTSVGATVPAYMSVSGSPITSAGTLGFSFNSATANNFFAAPNGSAGAPTFRAIVGADIPPTNLASTSNGGITGTLPISHGGTGATAGSGTVLDNLSGFSSTGIISRTGAGTYSFSTAAALIGSGSANTVFAAPNGSSGNGSFRALVGADLPTPTPSALGGVLNNACSGTNTFSYGIQGNGFQYCKSLVAAGTSTLGGVFSSSAGANQYATGIDTSGNVTYATLPTTSVITPIFIGVSSITASGTEYIGAGTAINATEAQAATPMATAGTASNLHCHLGTAASSGTATCTFRLNTSPTSLTCSISSGNTDCSDTTHSATFSVGDLWTVKQSIGNVATSATISFQIQ